VRATKLSPETIEKITHRAEAEIEQATLAELRQGLAVTQVDLAAAAEMTQSELSRLESRSDHRISTLRRYVEALGGKLEITAVFRKRRVRLNDV
jgi:predicted transcriptional regulator